MVGAHAAAHCDPGMAIRIHNSTPLKWRVTFKVLTMSKKGSVAGDLVRTGIFETKDLKAMALNISSYMEGLAVTAAFFVVILFIEILPRFV